MHEWHKFTAYYPLTAQKKKSTRTPKMARSRVKVRTLLGDDQCVHHFCACVKYGIAIARVTWLCVTREPWHAYYAYYPVRTIDRRNSHTRKYGYIPNGCKSSGSLDDISHLHFTDHSTSVNNVLTLPTPTNETHNVNLAALKIKCRRSVVAEILIHLYVSRRLSRQTLLYGKRGMQIFRNAFNKICFIYHWKHNVTHYSALLYIYRLK